MDEWKSPYTCVAIDAGNHLVPMDADGGSLGLDTGRLPHSRSAAGIDAADVDVAFITHAHPDHRGGISNADAALIFPDARFVVHRDEWKFWIATPEQAGGRAPDRLRNARCAALEGGGARFSKR